ncbi:LLM class flavin-dependent oxidoreductase [Sphingobium sp. MK2]
MIKASIGNLEGDSMGKMLHLGVLITPNGAHNGAWRLPSSKPENGFKLNHYVDIAQTAERGKLDFLFLADGYGMLPQKSEATAGRSPMLAFLEPFTLLSSLAGVTKHIGLAGSGTTTYFPPYMLARFVASLDHLSGGRAGWNLITSANHAEAWNFGYEQHPDKDDRYKKASEFADVVLGLWDSWKDDAFKFDKEKGQFFAPDGFKYLNHVGEHFKVKGPLTMPRTPQGRPVVAQAGSSEDGRHLAARTAEVVFTAQQNFEGAKAFYTDMRERLAKAGRKDEEMAILPGIVPVVGRTMEEAQAKATALRDSYPAELGIELLNGEFGIDLSVYPLDQPLPDDLPSSPLATSRRDLMIGFAKREGLTLGQLASATASLGHWMVVGTPEMIADLMEKCLNEGAADGFIVMPAAMPTSLNDFVELVVPELQRRGIFRTEYEGTTLRDNLGLKVPARTI